ncbi:MAG: BatA domain-containing protein [Gemmataceae bacterium]
MTFIFPALLAGLALTVLPVVLHLILRQQPKQLPFPAFRFLARKATTNRRRLRLRHLLLLLLRILMVALMCLALARPRVLNERLSLSSERAAAAVLVIDTSLSMGYTVAGKTRLDEAKSRALEIVGSLPATSKLAIVDPSEPGGDWQTTQNAARERLATRDLQASATPLTDCVAAGYRLFDAMTREAGEEDDPPPRFLYVLTDRTPACWDTSRTKDLVAARDRLKGPPIQQIIVDVGIDKPADVAISDIRLTPQVVPANKPVSLSAVVQATGQDVEAQVQFRISGLPEVDSKSVQVSAGQSKEVVFSRRGLKPGLYQAEISLASTDALLADNVRFVTFEVREPRPVLIVCEQTSDATTLLNALQTAFPCEVKTSNDPSLRALAPADLAKYRAVILLSVPAPTRDLWEKLDAYVAGGGGLIVFPAGEELDASDYNSTDTPAQRLIPGTFQQILSGGDSGVKWSEYQYNHPLMAKFRDYAMDPSNGFAENPPRTYRYWEVKPEPSAFVLVRYADEGKHAALLETTLDRQKYRGKVLLFTTPFDHRRVAEDKPWNDYAQWWFYLTIADHAIRYVGGANEDAEFNHTSGRMVNIALPANVKSQTLNLTGPGLSGPDSLVRRPEKGQEVRLTQARTPGNFTLATPDKSWTAGFSVNPPTEEFQLLPRVPVETLAEVFGPDAVLAPGHEAPLRDKLDQHFRQPVELFPWLMLLLFMLFVVENLLANRFYKRP